MHLTGKPTPSTRTGRGLGRRIARACARPGAEVRSPASVAPGAQEAQAAEPLPAGTAAAATAGDALDLAPALNAVQTLASDSTRDRPLETMLPLIIEYAGAQCGVFLREHDDRWLIVARYDVDRPGGTSLASVPLDACEEISRGIVTYVKRTGETVLIDGAEGDERLASDPYILSQRPKSIVCMPVLHQAQLLGILYLEHRRTAQASTPQRLALLQVLSWHLAIFLEVAQVRDALQRAIEDCRQAQAALQEALAEVTRLKGGRRAEHIHLRDAMEGDDEFDEIVGRSPALLRVLHQVKRVAGTDTTVLILGETGTGKELIARAIHHHSGRKDRPLVRVNCAALPPTLIESELFGHEKGAFTGALARKVGRFELADGGTIFLDEIGELPLDLQAKLLRVLQDGTFERVGSVQTTTVDVRVIAATNRHLVRQVAAGHFRDDLYYRLSVFPVTLPPLRERREDIPLLAWYFIAQYQGKLGKPIERIPERTMATLVAYHWPGNIRELANVIERAMILSPGATLVVDEELGSIEPSGHRLPSMQPLEAVERAHILAVLEACHGRIKGAGQAAERLGLHPSTLYSRLRKLGIARQS
jgi:transcriptional regulator with GAF, ATPase, and Fis domain